MENKKNKIKIGVIGCHYWGPKIIRNFKSLEDCEVEIVSDLDVENLKEIESKYPGIKTTKDYKLILNNPQIEAVSIVTPASTHYSLAKEFLSAGKHVLTEKPMAIKVKEAEELIFIAKEKNKILMVGHTFEYSPIIRKIKEIIKSGELGDIYFIYSSRVNLGLHRPDVNVLWDLAPHDISILTYLLDKNPINVSARGKSFLRKGLEDFAFIEFEFPGEVISHVHVSWLSPIKERRMIIIGSKKMLLYDDVNSEQPLAVYDKGIDSVIFKESNQKNVSYYDKGMYLPRISQGEPLKIECQHFIDCIRENKPPLTNGRRGMEVLKILESIQKSLDLKGELVKIN
jgi:predicted dehydrogenase